MPPWQKRFIAGSVWAAWVTGVALFLVKTFGQTTGEWGGQRSVFETPLRAVHGGAMMVLLAAVGTALASHIRAGWDTGTRRRSAFLTGAVLILLVGTGWSHYYVGNEAFRPWIGWAHTMAGGLLGPIFWIHSRRREPF